MAQIDAIGFDMDFTLAQYTKEFDLLAYEGAKEKLVNWLGIYISISYNDFK